MKIKNKKKKLFNHIKFSLLVGLCAFLIILTTTSVASWLYMLLNDLGIINDSNSRIIWFLNYAVLCTILGSILSTVVVNTPAKRTQKLLDAMEKIANGDFSVRVTSKSKLRSIKKIVKMFNHMAAQLSSTEMLSRNFINNFSHEFKTPIASINGFAKLLKDPNISEDEKNEYIDIIIRESERLSNLSANILALSKLEQQTIVTNKTRYNLNEQIRVIIGSLYSIWSKKNIRIEFTGDECMIDANKDLIGQVWVNLLDNAIKFSPENKTIAINISNDEGNIYITMANYGKTVTKNQADRIFDKFFQGDESHATNGNGLGLSLVKRITELHSGSVSFDVSDSEKTVVNIILPVEQID